MNKKNVYEIDEIGAYMSGEYISVSYGASVGEAMSELIRRAGETDNISMLYVLDEQKHLVGTIELKSLIMARQNDELEGIIDKQSPCFLYSDELEECIESFGEYDRDSVGVVDEDRHLLGIITSDAIIELIESEMDEDYARLAGLTAKEEAEESTSQSVKKRLPWLLILLILGMLVSSVVGVFEGVVAALPMVICFQSLVLDMAGNVGTQSLAVTIREITEENKSSGKKARLVLKEIKIGAFNGIFLGAVEFVFLGVYINIFKGCDIVTSFGISGCVGVSLIVAMIISGLVGCIVPILFDKINIDPAAASGPLITTVNDLVAVIAYYGMTYLLLIK